MRLGDLVEFDRQSQLKNARDREAEYRNFVEQINKKHGEFRSARAIRDSDLQKAVNEVRIAELGTVGNELVAKTVAEKNVQTLEEAKAVTRQMTLEKAAAHITCPFLIVHGENDRQIPLWHEVRAGPGSERSPASTGPRCRR